MSRLPAQVFGGARKPDPRLVEVPRNGQATEHYHGLPRYLYGDRKSATKEPRGGIWSSEYNAFAGSRWQKYFPIEWRSWVLYPRRDVRVVTIDEPSDLLVLGAQYGWLEWPDGIRSLDFVNLARHLDGVHVTDRAIATVRSVETWGHDSTWWARWCFEERIDELGAGLWTWAGVDRSVATLAASLADPLRGAHVPSVSRYSLDHYRPRLTWSKSNHAGVHGTGHAARVLVFADQLAEAVDREVVRWAAVVHDVSRLNDGPDLLHGERGAKFFLLNAARIAGNLSVDQRQSVAYCVEWHVPPDSTAPKMTPELRVLKDADGLDRLRFNGLDPKMLRTAAARVMIDQAQALVNETNGGSWDDVRTAAIARGLWR